MDAAPEFPLALGLVTALGLAGLRFGPSNALEGLYLSFALVGLRLARVALSGLRGVIRWLAGR